MTGEVSPIGEIPPKIRSEAGLASGSFAVGRSAVNCRLGCKAAAPSGNCAVMYLSSTISHLATSLALATSAFRRPAHELRSLASRLHRVFASSQGAFSARGSRKSLRKR